MRRNLYSYLPDRLRLAIGLVTVVLAWWLYVFPRDCCRTLRHVAVGSWHDAVLLWRGMLAGERIDVNTDPLDLENE